MQAEVAVSQGGHLRSKDETLQRSHDIASLGKPDCTRVILHFDVDAFYAQCEVRCL